MNRVVTQILATDLNPGDLFYFLGKPKQYRCHRASRLFKPNGDPSDQMYLATGNSGADCIVVYLPSDKQVQRLEPIA